LPNFSLCAYEKDVVALNEEMQNLLNAIALDDDEVEILLDPHREMRLEIEDMSYEKFIPLGERICSVSTGLSEETITAQLETKVYTRNPNIINL